MVLLIAESTRLYDHLLENSGEGFFYNFFTQFTHHPWNGLRFWDLIQPGFMFMAGTAMAFSLHRQQQDGIPWNDSLIKALKRSGWLFFWGVLDYAVRRSGLSFELWDVLTQLSFTLLVSFLIYRWSITSQVVFSMGLLALTEILYRFSDIPGFDQPFVDQHNFGNFMDTLLMNKINPDGWVAINCIPTAAHTIWGAIAGKLLLSDRTGTEKVKPLIISGILCLIIGFTMDYTFTPIIKRIATTSFTIASGGWCLLALAISYWWIDLKNHRQHLQFFTIVGMNSIFIYLFFEIVGARWFYGYVSAITDGLMSMVHIPLAWMSVITSLCLFSLDWGLCYFLFKKRIFFKL